MTRGSASAPRKPQPARRGGLPHHPHRAALRPLQTGRHGWRWAWTARPAASGRRRVNGGSIATSIAPARCRRDRTAARPSPPQSPAITPRFHPYMIARFRRRTIHCAQYTTFGAGALRARAPGRSRTIGLRLPTTAWSSSATTAPTLALAIRIRDALSTLPRGMRLGPPPVDLAMRRWLQYWRASSSYGQSDD